jgi:hypothetical protein
MSGIKVKVSTEEIVKSKFTDSLSTIEGYLKEAEGDYYHGTDYSARAVVKRISDIKDKLLNDLENLAKSIEVNE